MRQQKFTSVPCPVCGAHDYKFVYAKRDLRFLCSEYRFSIVKCRMCGAGYILDPPDADSLKQYYPSSFYAANHAGSGRKAILEKKWKFLRSVAPQTGNAPRLLDVGCAGGEFVQYVRGAGWNATGYEWAAAPRSAGEHIIQASRLEGCFPSAFFDIVTAWAVLEHASNLHELIQSIANMLKPQGIFIALVTNFNSIPGRIMQQDDIPRHLNLFTKSSLSYLLGRYGLTPTKWTFSDEIFSGTHRGLLVFLLKRLFGEDWPDIVSQHRAPGRRDEFCTMLRGQESMIAKAVCTFDRILFTPVLDALMNSIHCGFTMIVVSKKIYNH